MKLLIQEINFRAYHYKFIPEIERKTRAKYNFKNLPSLLELEQKTILMFVNTDNSFGFPEPLQPNMIEVGGLQIVEAKPLAEASFQNSRKLIFINQF